MSDGEVRLMKINAAVCVRGSRWLHGNVGVGAERERLIRNPKTCVRGELSCRPIFKPTCQLDSWESGPGVGGVFHTILALLMLMHPRPSGYKILWVDHGVKILV